jgi:hypothetical protein
MSRLNQAAIALIDVELRQRTQINQRQRTQSACFAAHASLSTHVATRESQATAATVESLTVTYELVSHRLQRLKASPGEPLTYAELRKAIVDLVPDFSDRVLRRAAVRNQQRQQPWHSSLGAVNWGRSLFGMTMISATAMGVAAMVSTLSLTWRPFPQLNMAAIAEVDWRRPNELIVTAQSFAQVMEPQMRQTPQSATDWQRIAQQWQEAIELLQLVPERDRNHAEAQRLIQTYRQHQTTAQRHLKQERQGTEALKAAKAQSIWLARQTKLTPSERATTIRRIERQLDTIDKHSAVFPQVAAVRKTLNRKTLNRNVAKSSR